MEIARSEVDVLQRNIQFRLNQDEQPEAVWNDESDQDARLRPNFNDGDQVEHAEPNLNVDNHEEQEVESQEGNIVDVAVVKDEVQEASNGPLNVAANENKDEVQEAANGLSNDTANENKDEVQEAANEPLNDAANENKDTVAQESLENNNAASRSRKKNLRKKRRRQLRAQSGDLQPRPYGHKRRRKNRKTKEGEVQEAATERSNDAVHENKDVVAQEAHKNNNAVSRSRKKNLKKKRRRQLKALRGDVQPQS